MNKLLLFGFLVPVGCGGSDKQPVVPQVTVDAIGSYAVTAYIVGGDTIFAVPPINGSAKGGINKAGVDSFFMTVKAAGEDHLIVSTMFWQKGLRSTFAKEVTIKPLDNYYYGFFPVKEYAPTRYEGKLRRFTETIVERTTGGGILMPPRPPVS